MISGILYKPQNEHEVKGSYTIDLFSRVKLMGESHAMSLQLAQLSTECSVKRKDLENTHLLVQQRVSACAV